MALLSQRPADDVQHRHLERMVKAIDNMSKVIRFTKDYEGMGTLEPRWQALRTQWDLDSAKFDLGGVSLRFDVEGVEVNADPMLERVFFNLFDNSLRHGGPVTSIGLSHSTDGQDLLVVYADNGCGVPVAEKESIYEMGYGSNTGLGLFLSQAILGMSGLTISETGRPGEGAHFVTRVPPNRYRRPPSPVGPGA